MSSDVQTEVLSAGQIEVQKIINSFLEEYETLRQKENATRYDYYDLYKKVRNEFGSNHIIKNDSVTSQPLDNSGYSKNYLRWLVKNGVEEIIESTSNVGFPNIDFPMKKIIYDRRNSKLEPVYLGGVKWDSTISCLFGLAQGKRLNAGGWNSSYYDAIQLWQVGGDGNHRLLSHILFGSNQINPYQLRIVRNDFTDPQLNESLCQFDELFDEINSNREYYIELAFNVKSLSEESIAKIKNFFCDIKADEKVDLVRCINAIKKIHHEYYISNDWGTRKIEIDNIYRLLSDIRRLRSKPSWYRQLLILKQKFLGIKTVDSITCTVLHLATWDTPYWKNGDIRDEGWLRYLPGLRQLLLALLK